MAKAKQQPTKTAPDVTAESRIPNAASLAWLADAPMFIDERQVAAFHDAVIQPPTSSGTITMSTKNLKVDEKTIEASVGAKVSIAKWITTIFPFLDAEVSGDIKGGAKSSQSNENNETIVLYPISTPQRQLVQLALHYAATLSTRLVVVEKLTDMRWHSPEFIAQVPRALAFIDFPPGTIFIPIAAELSTGEVKRIYDKSAMGETPPRYPEAKTDLQPDELKRLRKEYWDWYRERFSAHGAMNELETAVKESSSCGRTRWIDYRVPVGTEGDTIHLHVCGREQYDTGTFAYKLVKRGEKHGLRMVGTLKSEPDVNVLAIFEK